jgi:hypothetical protein
MRDTDQKDMSEMFRLFATAKKTAQVPTCSISWAETRQIGMLQAEIAC